MIHRPWLLLSAMLTVTVPGVLALLAILGHDHAAVETVNLAAASPGDTTMSGPLPVAPAETSMPVRNAVASVQSTSGVPVTVDGTSLASEQALGMKLLAEAAQASQVTSYAGIEMSSEAGVSGTEATTISQVWHSGRGLTLMQTTSTDADVLRSPEGVFGLTRALVTLLGQHYVAVYRGTGYTIGRPASLVEVYRFDGSLAARFWLDKKTLVPLKRELFDTADQPVGEDTFTEVRFGALAEQPVGQAAAIATARAESAWVTATAPGELLASLAGEGWRLPAVLPDNLPLYQAAANGSGAGEVIDLEYSDGLSVVSLFVQRGTLAPNLAGWRAATLGGHQVYVSGHSITWSWHGLVCTMIADAPPRTVTDAVAALPRSTPAGVLGRLGRGFDRMVHLVDPFG